MRKVIYGCAVTLDGYIARPDGAVDYLVMDKDTEKLMAAFFAKLDTILYGRKTIEAQAAMMASAGSGDAPPEPPPGGRGRTTPSHAPGPPASATA